MKFLLTIIFFCSVKCEGQSKADTPQKATKSFYSEITRQFLVIDSLRNIDYDQLEIANNEVIRILNAYKADIFNFPDTLDYDLIYLVKSSDKMLALISWDTRTGGTMIAFTTMAIFKTPEGIRTKMLLDTTDEDMPFTYMHYNSINSITASNGKKIYLAWGNGQGSTIIPWQELKTFSIANDKLVEPKILPNTSSNLRVEFDLHEFGGNQKVPVIKIKNSGRTIQVPIETDRQGFSGKYKTYVFNGKVFK
ncbi:MAG: hypothetical protein ABI851_11600 [Saprospiraceae bacterium]